MLDLVASPSRQLQWDAVRHRLRELGYKEGTDIVYEFRSADGHLDHLDGLAVELVRLPVDLIVTATTPAALAAKRATKTIPIVMTNTGDPVGTGLVANLARPGGNVTGLRTLSTELSVKRLELLREIVPTATRIAALWDEANPAFATAIDETRAVGKALNLQVLVFGTRSLDEIERAFNAMVSQQARALIVMPGSILFAERRRVVDLAAKSRLPTAYAQREYVEAGGLMAYGASLTDIFERASYFVDRILKGANPAVLPIEQPTKFELVINLKTAKTLGLTIPPSLLARADQVLE